MPIPYDEGAFPPDGEQGVGPVPEQDGQRVTAPHPCQSLGQGPQRLAVITAVDQLDQHLGIRLADKGISLGLQHRLQGPVVFNDAVVHDADIRGGMGMAVDVAGFPVGGPPGVPDAAVGGGQAGGGGLFQFGPQGGQPPLALDDPDAALYSQGQASRVVPAVLQLGQAVQQYVLGAASAHIAYNATHKQNTSLGCVRKFLNAAQFYQKAHLPRCSRLHSIEECGAPAPCSCIFLANCSAFLNSRTHPSWPAEFSASLLGRRR